MKTIEYRTIDKSAWPRGEWDAEPDKVQWQDEATGLPCLIVRNSGGALCGYVGLSEGHPLYGKSYSTRVPVPASFSERKCDDTTPIVALFCEAGKDDGLVSLELAIEVHGGLTFSDFCGEHTRDAWEAWLKRQRARASEAEKYPQGDAATCLREWASELDDFDAWVAKAQATHISHLPDAGEPDRVWWLGFDCSHIDDMSPAYDGLMRDRVYRTLRYVQQECANLARQLIERRSTV